MVSQADWRKRNSRPAIALRLLLSAVTSILRNHFGGVLSLSSINSILVPVCQHSQLRATLTVLRFFTSRAWATSTTATRLHLIVASDA